MSNATAQRTRGACTPESIHLIAPDITWCEVFSFWGKKGGGGG